MKSKPPKNALRVDVYSYRESITYNLGDLDHRKDGRLDDPLDDPYKVFHKTVWQSLVFGPRTSCTFPFRKMSFEFLCSGATFLGDGRGTKVLENIWKNWLRSKPKPC